LNVKMEGKVEVAKLACRYTYTEQLHFFALKTQSSLSFCFTDIRSKEILVYCNHCLLLLSWRKERKDGIIR